MTTTLSKRAILMIGAFAANLSVGNGALAATATADVTQVVSTALAISKTQDLLFPATTAPAAALTLAPADAGHAEFNVTGEAGRNFRINLPAAGINLDNGSGATIAVSSFVSLPAGGGGHALPAGGQILKVGASRAALPASQAAGTYTGSFTVEVLYE